MNYAEKMTNYYDFLLSSKAYWHKRPIKSLNYGYWENSTRNDKKANQNLVDKLLQLIPKKDGVILDVACGEGQTTRCIAQYYEPSNITGINISKPQLDQAKINANSCNFLLMDATNLDFKDNSIDNIICVEAAFHFNTREKFIKEAFRILKPSGHLVMSDIFLKSLKLLDKELFPPENIIKNDEDYKKLFINAGFKHIILKDVTKNTFVPFRSRMIKFYWKGIPGLFYYPKDWFVSLFFTTFGIITRTMNVKAYILVSAQKPI